MRRLILWGVAGVVLLIAAVVGISLLRGADTPPAPKLPKEAAPAGPLAGTLRSDEARRDDAMRFRGLETDDYPRAAFALGAPVKVAPSFTARGTLALHGRAQPVRVRLRSRRAGRGLDLVGSVPIRFADYGMEPPSVAGVASVRDHGTMEVRLRLR